MTERPAKTNKRGQANGRANEHAPDPRYDIQAEDATIGAVLLDPQRLKIPSVRKLEPSHFFDAARQRVWGLIRDEEAKGKLVDVQVIRSRLNDQPGEKLGDLFLSKIINSAGTGYAAEHFADRILRKAKLRKHDSFADEIKTLVESDCELETIQRVIDRHRDDHTNNIEVIGSFSAMASKKENQQLRQIVIDGIAREGETINIVSDSKVGKTWFVHLLALMICIGRDWLGFGVRQGKVLILDNELHEPTLVNRIRQIAHALNIPEEEYSNNLHPKCFRGNLIDIHEVINILNRIEPGTYKVIILDSLYRFAPKGFDENSNTDTTEIYNLLDAAAARLGCVIICVRHSSKGSQSNKSVTDTGAGAGAQSRAVDAHMVLRAHEEDNAFVMAAALRSFPRMEPKVIKFEWPLFFPDDTNLDPEALAPVNPKRKAKADDSASGSGTLEPGWTADRFVTEFVTAVPQSREAILLAATSGGLSQKRAGIFMKIAEEQNLVHLHRDPGGDGRKKFYANVPEFVITDTPPKLVD